MIQEILDEVPDTSLQPDGNLRFTITDNYGKVIHDDVQIYIKTPIVTSGTELNRATLANLQGDLYTQDRYNIPNITYEKTSEPAIHTDNPLVNFNSISEIKCINEMWTVNAVSSSDAESYALINMFDGSTFTEWRSAPTTTTKIWLEHKTPIKITKLKIHFSTSDGYNFTNAIIEGSTDGLTWKNIHTLTSTVTPLTEITLSNPDYYTQYRFTFNLSSSTEIYIPELQISEWEGSYYECCNNLSLPLTSYEIGKIVNIQGVADEEQKTFENPYININQLGMKQINGTIEAGEKYILVYNGESWDATKPYKIIKGTYTGASSEFALTEQTINLGATPKAVIVYSMSKYSMVAIKDCGSFGTNSMNGTSNSEGDLAYKDGYGDITIVEGGFVASGYRSYGFNNDSANYKYIAIF